MTERCNVFVIVLISSLTTVKNSSVSPGPRIYVVVKTRSGVGFMCTLTSSSCHAISSWIDLTTSQHSQTLPRVYPPVSVPPNFLSLHTSIFRVYFHSSPNQSSPGTPFLDKVRERNRTSTGRKGTQECGKGDNHCHGLILLWSI